jgi:hypothetical protein
MVSESSRLRSLISKDLVATGIGLTVAAIIDNDLEYLQIQLKRFNLEMMNRRPSNQLLQMFLQPALVYNRYQAVKMIVRRWQESNIVESRFPILTQLFVEPDISEWMLYSIVSIFPEVSFTEHAMALINDQASYENLIAFRRLIKIFQPQGYRIYKTLIDYIFTSQNLNTGFANDIIREEIIVQLKATSSFAEKPDWITMTFKAPNKKNRWSLLDQSDINESIWFTTPIECLLYENVKEIASPWIQRTAIDKIKYENQNLPGIGVGGYRSPEAITLSPLEANVTRYDFSPHAVTGGIKSLDSLSPGMLIPISRENKSPLSPRSTQSITSSIGSLRSTQSITSSIGSPVRSPMSPRDITTISKDEKTPPKTSLSSFIPSAQQGQQIIVSSSPRSFVSVKQPQEILYYNPIPTELAIKVLSTNYHSMSDITIGGYEEVADDLRLRYSTAIPEEKIEMLKPYYQLLAAQRKFYDTNITKIKGPANIGFGWTLEDLQSDKAYMFLCNDYVSLQDYEREVDDSLLDDKLGITSDEKDPYGWFTGNCECCFRKIFKAIYAVRRPRIDGGWDGCYCSWGCVRNDVVEPNYIQEQLISHFEDLVYSNGIFDNQKSIDTIIKT